MSGWALAQVWWLPLAYYVLAVVSAVLPWMNAEALMLSALPLASSGPQLMLLVLVVTAGQMTGKSAMYWVSRRAGRPASPRVRASLDAWQTRLAHHPRLALAVVFISSTLGLPPFYVVSIAAGALKVAFAAFLIVGTCGRLAHFAAIAFVSQRVWCRL